MPPELPAAGSSAVAYVFWRRNIFDLSIKLLLDSSAKSNSGDFSLLLTRVSSSPDSSSPALCSDSRFELRLGRRTGTTSSSP